MRLSATSLCALLAPAAVLLLPGAAHACAVCGAASSDAERVAFIVTTGILTVTPLAMVGAALLWIRGRVAEMELHHLEARRLHRGGSVPAPTVQPAVAERIREPVPVPAIAR